MFWNRVLGHSFFGEFKLHTKLNQEITTFTCSPIMNYKVAETVFRSSRAVIIQAFGMGNVNTSN